jgi:hypothetical protein
MEISFQKKRNKHGNGLYGFIFKANEAQGLFDVDESQAQNKGPLKLRCGVQRPNQLKKISAQTEAGVAYLMLLSS